MSEEQAIDDTVEGTMSSEDKFFGVKTVIGKKGNEVVDDIDVEVVDDRPPEDRRPPAKKEAKKEEVSDDDDGDDELAGYSEKVKKRINKLRYEQHEERRQREAAERMREEAIRVAQQYAEQNKQYQQALSQGEQYIVQQVRQRAQLELDQAKSLYKTAYEEGNTDKVLEAQEKLINAQAEFKAAEAQFTQLQNKRPQQPQRFEQDFQQLQQQSQSQQQPQVAKPSEKALTWAKENPWFGNEDHKDMTALAYGVHEQLITKQGYDPNSDEYFEAIDRTMRSRFPDYFGEDSTGSGEEDSPSSTSRSPSVVVAPSSRNNGAKPRKVRLSRTQLALAKRLGLTAEQYANQLIKES